MAIQYVGGQTASITASTATNTTITFALTGGLASVPAAGDYVVLSYSIGSTVARTPAVVTTGYTAFTALTASDTFDANLRTAYKLMGGTPDTTVVVGPTGATTDGGFVTIHVLRGVNQTTFLDATQTTATGINGGTPNPAAITPASAQNVIYVVGANGHGTTGTMTASYTTSFLTGQNVTPTNKTTMGAGLVTGRAAGVSYDPAAFTWSATANTQSWAAYTVAIKAAPVNVSTTVTGLSATGDVGQIDFKSRISVSVTSPSMTGEVGTASAAAGAITSVTAPAATGEVGQTDVSGHAHAEVTGVEGVGAAGQVDVNGHAHVYPEGVGLSTGVGTVAVSIAVYTPAWGIIAGAPIATGILDGAGAGVAVLVTGLSASGGVGSVTISAGTAALVADLPAFAEVGQVEVSAHAHVPLTGVSAAGGVGQVEVSGHAHASVTSPAATGAVGAVLVEGHAHVQVSDVPVFGYVGDVTVYLQQNVYVDAPAAIGEVGIATAINTTYVEVTGLEAVASGGAVEVKTRIVVYLTGLQAAGYVGTPFVWGTVVPTSDPNYQPVVTPTSVWVNIGTTASSYTDVVPNGSSGYAPITTTNTDWTVVAA